MSNPSPPGPLRPLRDVRGPAAAWAVEGDAAPAPSAPTDSSEGPAELRLGGGKVGCSCPAPDHRARLSAGAPTRLPAAWCCWDWDTSSSIAAAAYDMREAMFVHTTLENVYDIFSCEKTEIPHHSVRVVDSGRFEVEVLQGGGTVFSSDDKSEGIARGL